MQLQCNFVFSFMNKGKKAKRKKEDSLGSLENNKELEV
jgi:hypothetical protein